MNLPVNLQQEINQWALVQGISPDDLIQQAVAEKLQQLHQQAAPVKPETVAEHSTRLRRKNGVLILETDSDPAIDVNAWIEELREERTQEQMAL
jgi:predicted nucleic acid-binding Zn ribbon protein